MGARPERGQRSEAGVPVVGKLSRDGICLSWARALCSTLFEEEDSGDRLPP